MLAIYLKMLIETQKRLNNKNKMDIKLTWKVTFKKMKTWKNKN